jgi:antitoxin (DNA-binding transcriptional repressor) of toxin-antitoxin stability system
MHAVGIDALRDRLSEWVKVAAEGETVLITDEDRVIAQLCPPGARRSVSPMDARLAQAIQEGWIKPAIIPPGTPMLPRKPVASFDEVMQELEEDRDDR